MRKALIIDQQDIDTFADIRAAITSARATAIRYRTKHLSAKDALDTMIGKVEEADEALTKFYESGL